MNIWWDIDNKTGVVIHDSISWIDDDFEIDENTIFDFSQDLLQISFKENQLLDVGWYPDLDVDGVFRIVLIKDRNWEYPMMKCECLTIKSLKKNINKIIKDYFD